MRFRQTFRDFPPIQLPNTFTINEAIGMMSKATAND
jgi:hypothetical protein